MKARQLPYKSSWHFDFGHPIEEVWPYVSDTDRINQALGLPHANYSVNPDPDGGAHRSVSFRVKGMLFRWEEHPYEWVLHKNFSVQRSYKVGPLKEMDAYWEFERIPENRCRIKQTVYYAARNRILSPLVKFQMTNETRKGFLAAYQQIEDFLSKKDSHAFHPLQEDLSLVDRGPSLHLRKRLREMGTPESLTDRLIHFIFESYQSDLLRIRPFRLATLWNEDRLEVLTAFLRGAEAGIFNLSWDFLCPRCRGAKVRLPHLKEWNGKTHCDSCNIEYDSQFDQSVELSFSMNPSVRKITVGEFCIGGPQNTPHYLIQKRVLSQHEETVHLQLSEGKYRIRSLQSKKVYDLEISSAAGVSHPEINCTFKRGRAGTEVINHSPADIHLRIHNGFEREITVLVERTQWLEDACTAAYVTTLQEFRRRFSSEVLKNGREVSVGAVALLFTDLKGSTAMYQSIGDAEAFRLVQRHFEILIECVEKNEGGLVKTIGDAVMAAFTKPENAVAAAIEIQKRMEELNKTESVKLKVKIGIHFGPCYAVTMNDRLDYFGGTVNIAARTEGQCVGNDIVISSTMMKVRAVTDLLQKNGLPVQKFLASLKGLDENFELFRINCDGANFPAWPIAAGGT